MTQNEVSIIKNSVLDATEAYVDARLSVANFVKTQIGIVVSATQNTSDKKWYHVVRCNATQSNPNGIVYRNVLSVNNIHFENNSVVFVFAPNAQFSNQFILGKLDNVPYDITAGSIHIGKIGNTDDYYFNVESNGTVSIKKGSINIANKFYVDDTGNLYLGGTTTSNANFYVTNTGKVTIKSGSITLSNAFKVDETGWLAIGGTTSSANFYVDTTGAVTIKKGSMTIGNNFKIDTSGNLAIGGTTSSANFYVQSSDGSVTIKRGSINIGGGNFEVDSTGSVICKDLTANVGGSIGGFAITSDALGDSLGSSNCVGMKSGDKLFAWNPSGYTYIQWNEIYKKNGRIVVENGGDELTITHENIHCDAHGNVVWHDEISDKRYKRNIEKLSSKKIQDFFNKIEPSAFMFDKNKDECKEKDEFVHYGVIAQNLQSSLKQAKLNSESLVKQNKDKMLLVDYQEFHGLELAGIKDLYDITQNQQKEIDMLKKQLGV